MISKHKLIQLYWTQRKPLKSIGQRYQVSTTAVWKWMRQLKVERRSKSQALLVRYNPTPPFQIRALSPQQEFLCHVGTLLYWCEGTHRDKRGRRVPTLTFTNSDEKALRIWLRFLREVCHLREDKLRVRLYLHQDQHQPELLRYWSAVLNVSPRQFERATVTASSIAKSKRNRSNYHGTVKIKVHSVALVEQVRQWIEALQHQLLGRGTQVVDGAALEKR